MAEEKLSVSHAINFNEPIRACACIMVRTSAFELEGCTRKSD
jgi:hypothetical protein